MNFSTLNEYVEWRNNMRTEYKKLSQTIRMTKHEIKEGMRSGKITGQLQISLIFLQCDASDMMEQRRNAKQIARESWKKWKEQKIQSAA